MNKNKIKEIIIAALVGAMITFLTQLLQGIIGLQDTTMPSALGGFGTAVVYLARNAQI